MTTIAERPSIELDRLLGYNLRRATSAVMADLVERMATLGLRTTDASALVVLQAEPLLSQSEIGRRLAVKRANMAPMIADLVARGLVARVETPGRAQPLRLTRKGLGLARRVAAAMRANEEEFFGALPDGERDALLRSLSTLWKPPAA